MFANILPAVTNCNLGTLPAASFAKLLPCNDCCQKAAGYCCHSDASAGPLHSSHRLTMVDTSWPIVHSSHGLTQAGQSLMPHSNTEREGGWDEESFRDLSATVYTCMTHASSTLCPLLLLHWRSLRTCSHSGKIKVRLVVEEGRLDLLRVAVLLCIDVTPGKGKRNEEKKKH